MIKLIEKIIRRLILEIIWWKNKLPVFLFKGNIKLGYKTRFNQPLILMGGGTILIGNYCSFGYEYGGGFKNNYLEFQVRDDKAIIEIGNNVATNNNLFLCARNHIVIKDDVLIGRNVTIMDHNAHGVLPTERRTSDGTARKIIIEENVWLGNYVTILPGTIIGKNSIVGAGSVVKGIFPENVIIQGNPAKIIKKIELGDKDGKEI